MKVTQIMLARGFGGAERLFVDFSLALARKGLEVQAICSSGSKAGELLAGNTQVALHSVSVLGAWDVFAAGRISRLLARHKSDIVQAHLARAALLAGKACAKNQVPLVVTTHNYIDVKYYRNVSMLVPPTRDQYEYYQRAGISPEKMHIIRHFSPLSASPGPRRENPQQLRFVALGRLVKKKGFEVLIRAFSRLLENGAAEHELHIGGEGPERATLEAEIRRGKLEERVKLVGWVDDVQAFLAGGDIFVLPSLDEPFGIVVLEAMAAGLPVVSTTTSGPLEILDDSIAWFCETGDDAAMFNALASASAGSDLRRDKGHNALQRFQQRYSTAAVIPEFIDLYERLLQAPPRPSPR